MAVVLLAGNLAAGAEPGESRRTVAAESLARIQAEVHYDPQAHVAAEQTALSASDGVIVLERMTIVESFQNRELARVVEQTQQKRQAEKFSLVRGGVLFQRGRVKVGGLGEGGPFKFLQISW